MATTAFGVPRASRRPVEAPQREAANEVSLSFPRPQVLQQAESTPQSICDELARLGINVQIQGEAGVDRYPARYDAHNKGQPKTNDVMWARVNLVVDRTLARPANVLRRLAAMALPSDNREPLVVSIEGPYALQSMPQPGFLLSTRCGRAHAMMERVNSVTEVATRAKHVIIAHHLFDGALQCNRRSAHDLVEHPVGTVSRAALELETYFYTLITSRLSSLRRDLGILNRVTSANIIESSGGASSTQVASIFDIIPTRSDSSRSYGRIVLRFTDSGVRGPSLLPIEIELITDKGRHRVVATSDEMMRSQVEAFAVGIKTAFAPRQKSS